MTEFTPLWSTFGGVLIGVASLLVLGGLGRVAGVSGIAAGLLTPAEGDAGWRGAFLAGLVVGGLVMALSAPALFAIHLERPLGLVAVAGLIVGVGTRVGGGCTSGHGVCGLGRLSQRSLVATLTFMLTAGLTVYLAYHVAGVGS